MYGDTARLRATARRLRDDADGLRARSSALVASVAAMTWSSRAGDALRARAGATTSALAHRARTLDDAADALDAHAAAVDRRKDEIADAERVAGAVLLAAHHLVSDVVHGAQGIARSAAVFAGTPVPPADVDRARARGLVARVPVLPPTGSQDWLHVRAEVQRAGVR